MLGRVLTSSQTRILNPPPRLFFLDVKEVEKWSRKLAINIQTVVTAERGGMISLWTNTESPCDGSSEDESCCGNNNLFCGSGRRRRIYCGSAALELQCSSRPEGELFRDSNLCVLSVENKMADPTVLWDFLFYFFYLWVFACYGMDIFSPTC